MATQELKTYQDFATQLLQLLGSDTAVRLTVPGFMPLSVEAIGRSGDGSRRVSLCHYGEQNGDMMRDPDMGFCSMTCRTAPPPSLGCCLIQRH